MTPPTPDLIDLPRYLARIGYDGPLAPTLGILGALQAAHIAAIAFEAFDVLTGKGVDIAADAVDAKLISAQRGGYCFEQNGLFLRALRAAGFDAEGLIGRVRWMLPLDAPATGRTHMAVRVMLDGRPWLVDVGFGAAVLPQPLALDSEAPQPTRHETYRAIAHDGAYRVQALIDDAWATLYDIDPVPAPAIDYEIGNWHTATHPASHFRHLLLAARTSATARHALRGNRLTTRHVDGRVEQHVLTADQIEAALKDIFLLPVHPQWRAAIEDAAAADVGGGAA